MSVYSEPTPARTGTCPRPPLAMVGAIALAALCVPSGIASAQVSAATPTSVGVRPVAAPHPVTPKVTDLAVPRVAPKDRGSIAAKLSDAEPAGAVLVAHLRKPRTTNFSMVGVTWAAGTATDGTTVNVRSRSQGTWSDWSAMDIDPEEGPSATEEASVRDGTAPAWAGRATGVEVAVYSPDGSTPFGLTVNAIDPGTSSYDSTATTTSSLAAKVAGPNAGAFPALPDVITRSEWGADPSLGDRCWSPRVGTTFKMVFVHHTAGSNDYTRAESAAVVRGVYAYHTQSRDWCDIGYNFLVDRYGDIYEGRRGGLRLPVRGSHAGDYNVDTTGVSLMGEFTSVNPTRRMKHSLVQLIAWRMGTAYQGAYGRPRVYGQRFSRISGHRDAMSTSCPGERVYDRLPAIRARVASRLSNFESTIEARWRAMGGFNSDLGQVHIGEQVENGGHHTTFVNGRMYSSGAGVYKLYRSPVLRTYVRHGETDGELGYPRSNLRSIVNGSGFSAEFAGGRIFWSQATGSTVLHRGAILQRYLAVGSAAGNLGFPLVPVHSTKTGNLARFQHGTISWDARTHKTVVRYS